MLNRRTAIRGAAIATFAMSATAFAQGTADTSKWRYLAKVDDVKVIVSDDAPGDEVRSLTTHSIFATPHSSGADGITTAYEVNCRTDTIKEIGSTALAGTRVLGKIPSQTKGAAVPYKAGSLFEAIATYACVRRLRSGDKKVVTGKTEAIAYARSKRR